MNLNKTQTLLYSTVGVGLMFVAIVGLNLLVSPMRLRVDATADKLHTLSDGTRRILAGLRELDTPIQVHYYISQQGNRLPTQLESFARQVEDMLNEYRAQSGGRLVIKKFDPEPDSEVEDAAKLDGIEPQRNPQNGEVYYLGLTILLEPNKVTIPSLGPERDRLLEYDLSRAISQVTRTDKPVIGVMTPLQAFGMPSNPMMMRMGQQGSEPWILISELRRDFEVRQLSMDVADIAADIEALLIIHPKDISRKTEYAIDQFILRGGRVVALLDPMCLADNSNPNPMGLNMGGGSTLPTLLPAWGFEFDTSRVVADVQFAREINFGRGPQMAPAFLFLNRKAINEENALLAQTDNLLFPFAGAFSGEPVAGIDKEVLIQSTQDSQMVDGMTAQVNSNKIMDEFTPSGKQFVMGMRLSGRFKTAFPEGRPEGGDADEDEEEVEPAAHLTEAKGEGVIYLFGDADFIYDPYCVQIERMLRIAIPFNGNLAMAQNLIEEVAGDSNLIGARSRASLRRPFTVVQEKEAEAQKRFQAEIARFQAQAEESQRRISELQSQREGNQRFILSPEATAELQRLQERQAEANKNLRRVRGELKREVETLKAKVKWINIGAMPLLVTLTGIGFAMARRRRTGAK